MIPLAQFCLSTAGISHPKQQLLQDPHAGASILLVPVSNITSWKLALAKLIKAQMLVCAFLHLIKSNKPQQLATNKMLRKLRSGKIKV